MFKRNMLEKRGNLLRQQRTLRIQKTQAIQRKERPITIVVIKGTTNMSAGFKRNRIKMILAMSRIPIMQIWLNKKLSWWQ
jgi:hypothetical protein